MRPLLALLVAGVILSASAASVASGPQVQRIAETVVDSGAASPLGAADPCEPLTQVERPQRHVCRSKLRVKAFLKRARLQVGHAL